MGTDAWRNWKAFDNGIVEIENLDDELHSERGFTGGPTALGSYRLSINTRLGRSDEPRRVGPVVRLHVGVHEHLTPDIVANGQLMKENSDAYRGGTASDEVAALISLALGGRLRVAGTAQMSLIHEDLPKIPRSARGAEPCWPHLLVGQNPSSGSCPAAESALWKRPTRSE